MIQNPNGDEATMKKLCEKVELNEKMKIQLKRKKEVSVSNILGKDLIFLV